MVAGAGCAVDVGISVVGGVDRGGGGGQLVIRPMRSPSSSVNHMLSSGPGVITTGKLPGLRAAAHSVTTPLVVICAMRSANSSVNHKAPSGPVAIPCGPLLALIPAENSVT